MKNHDNDARGVRRENSEIATSSEFPVSFNRAGLIFSF